MYTRSGHGALVVVAASGVLVPRAMLIDLVYNYGVRYVFGAPALSATPRPRCFSYAKALLFD
jgi:hypothetical protein